MQDTIDWKSRIWSGAAIAAAATVVLGGSVAVCESASPGHGVEGIRAAFSIEGIVALISMIATGSGTGTVQEARGLGVAGAFFAFCNALIGGTYLVWTLSSARDIASNRYTAATFGTIFSLLTLICAVWASNKFRDHLLKKKVS